MPGLLELFLPCFGVRRPPHKKEIPRAIPLEERPQFNKMPYRNSMARSMYYLGVTLALLDAHTKSTDPNVGPPISSTKVSHPSSPIEMIMALKNGREDGGSPLRCQQSHPLGRSPQHIRFWPEMPTRTSQLAGVVQSSPVDSSVFVLSSPGDVSPFSLDGSPTILIANPGSLQTPKANRTDRPAVGQTLPACSNVRHLTPQRPKPGRPSLTVKIPQSTEGSPVLVFTSASSGSDCSPESATMASLDTPAHARRLSAQASTKAGRKHDCKTLSDELASLSFSNSGVPSPSATAML